MSGVQVRFCPSARPTFDQTRSFQELPRRGETVIEQGARYVVVDIDWQEDGVPLLIAHSSDRPRARALA